MSDIVVKGKVVDPKQLEELYKTKRIWDNFQIIGEIRKNNNIKIVIGAAVRDGVRYINIREWYMRKRDGVWNPGRDGITIPIAVPIENATQIIKPYDGFMDLMQRTREAVETMELYDENNAIYAIPKEKKNA